MARKLTLTSNKTYATEANAEKAVAKVIGDGHPDLRYFIHRTADDRYLPVFIGQAAAQAGVHFHFNVIG